MKSEFLRVMSVIGAMYVLQVIVLPWMFPQFFPCSNEATTILFTTIGLFSFAGMMCASDKFHLWLLGDALYYLMMLIYSNGGAYDIGLLSIPVNGVMIPTKRLAGVYLMIVVAVITTAIQAAEWLLVKLLKWEPKEKKDIPPYMR